MFRRFGGDERSHDGQTISCGQFSIHLSRDYAAVHAERLRPATLSLPVPVEVSWGYRPREWSVRVNTTGGAFCPHPATAH